MIVDELLKRPGTWLPRDETDGIVLSSRVRLARNLALSPFPRQARQDEAVRVCQAIREACERATPYDHPFFLDMGALSPLDKLVLQERHLISHELAEKGSGSGLMLGRDEHTALMINEEDHLRLHAILPGGDLYAVWQRVDALDSSLEQLLSFAFSPRLGYLTACPSNVGTGLRASTMLHLPGLALQDEVDAVVRGLSKIGLAVRGLFGEGSQAIGNMYQVSNQITLGDTEIGIIEHLTGVIQEVVQHERNARARLLESRQGLLLDRIGRSYGILSNARFLPSGEAVELLSLLRLGVEMGFAKGVTVPELNEILLTTQPGHLQKAAGRNLGPIERDSLRSETIRNRLAELRLRTDEL